MSQSALSPEEGVDLEILMKEVKALPRGTKRSLYQKRNRWKKAASPFIMSIILKGASLFFKQNPPERISVRRSPKYQKQLLA